MKEIIQQKMYEALSLKYKSEIAECEATLMIYINNSVGIGEHPQQLDELDKLIEKLAAAKDKLHNLDEVFAFHLNKF
jgi:hypothetical protein